MTKQPNQKQISALHLIFNRLTVVQELFFGLNRLTVVQELFFGLKKQTNKKQEGWVGVGVCVGGGGGGGGGGEFACCVLS